MDTKVHIIDHSEGMPTPVELQSVQYRESTGENPSAFDEAVDPSSSTPSVLPSFSVQKLALMQREEEHLGIVWHRWTHRCDPGQSTYDDKQTPAEVNGWLKEWPRIKERNGILYRVVQDVGLGDIFQYLVPRRLRTMVTEAAHDQWGHQGIGRTLPFIKQRAFWSGLFPVQSDKGSCSIRPTSNRLSIDFVKLDRGLGNIEDVLVLTDAFTN